MIDLYYWPTPNGHKITIALEEMGLPYKIHYVDISKGDQYKQEFLLFSPCLLYTSPSPRDRTRSRMPSSA